MTSLTIISRDKAIVAIKTIPVTILTLKLSNQVGPSNTEMSRPIQRQYMLVVDMGIKSIQTTSADINRTVKGINLYIIKLKIDLNSINGGSVEGVFSAYSGANWYFDKHSSQVSFFE